MQDNTIGFIGLGKMGGKIAGHLLKSGNSLKVYDAFSDAIKSFIETNASSSSASTPDEIFEASSIVFLSVPGSPEVESIINQAMKQDLKGKIIVDLSTSYPPATRRLAASLKERDCVLLDAPLTGGPRQAEKGELNVIVAGDKTAYEKILPLCRTFGKNIFYVGSSGNGHAIKLVNNCLSGIYACLYVQIIPLVERLNLNPDDFLRVISVSGGNSPGFQAWAQKIINRDFTKAFTIELMDKDFAYIEELAREADYSIPILKAARALCEEAREKGLVKEDVSALIKITEKKGN